MIKPTVKTKGGNKLKRWMAEKQREAGRITIEVGFRDERIAPLAAQLEFGNSSTRLPERPAFRQALPAIRKVALETARPYIRANRGTLSYEGAVRVAVAARDVLRQSYLDFEGPGLSEWQIERKRGSPGAGQELIGSKGPKLVEQIKAWVNGREVG